MVCGAREDTRRLPGVVWEDFTAGDRGRLRFCRELGGLSMIVCQCFAPIRWGDTALVAGLPGHQPERFAG